MADESPSRVSGGPIPDDSEKTETSTPEHDKEYFWEPYKAASDTLRNWLIAYGAAVPYLFLSQQSGERALIPLCGVRSIVVFFAIGVILQVAQLALAKHVMMALYTGDHNSTFKKQPLYQWARWANDYCIPYLATDAATFLSYSLGTYLLYQCL